MKKTRHYPRMFTDLGLCLCLAGTISAAAPARADSPRTTATSSSATSASKIVVKVGDPIIIKDKKPAPKKK